MSVTSAGSRRNLLPRRLVCRAAARLQGRRDRPARTISLHRRVHEYPDRQRPGGQRRRMIGRGGARVDPAGTLVRPEHEPDGGCPEAGHANRAVLEARDPAHLNFHHVHPRPLTGRGAGVRRRPRAISRSAAPGSGAGHERLAHEEGVVPGGPQRDQIRAASEARSRPRPTIPACGISAISACDASRSTASVRRFRLFTPMMPASAARARASSVRSCTSTSTARPYSAAARSRRRS